MRIMLRLLSVGLLTAAVSVVSLGQQPALKDINLSVKKIGNVWKVVVAGTTTTEVHVVKGQRVIFTAEGSDLYFQFDNTNLFGGHTKFLKNGQKLTLGVGAVAKGIYVYSVFCDGPKAYAEGGSPPKIIVD